MDHQWDKLKQMICFISRRSFKFGGYKFLGFRENLAHCSNPHSPTTQMETFNHAEPTGDAQEKQACSYELAFVESKKFANSKRGAHLF